MKEDLHIEEVEICRQNIFDNSVMKPLVTKHNNINQPREQTRLL